MRFSGLNSRNYSQLPTGSNPNTAPGAGRKGPSCVVPAFIIHEQFRNPASVCHSARQKPCLLVFLLVFKICSMLLCLCESECRYLQVSKATTTGTVLAPTLSKLCLRGCLPNNSLVNRLFSTVRQPGMGSHRSSQFSRGCGGLHRQSLQTLQAGG